MRTPRRLFLLALTILAIGFVYGFVSGAKRIFPYSLIHAMYVAIQTEAPGDVDPEQQLRREIARLATLGYVQGSRQSSRRDSGVLVHDTERAFPGLNLMTSGHAPEAVLLDMSGTPVHTWHLSFGEVWPERVEAEVNLPGEHFGQRGQTFWRRVHLLDDGGLLAVFQGWGLIRIDKDSRLIWALEGGYHHDVDVASDGTIYALHHQLREIPRLGGEVLDDEIAVISAQGQVMRRLSLVDALENSSYAPSLARRRRDSPDIFHTNSIQVLEGVSQGESPAFRNGNVLISLRNLDLIASVNLDAGSVQWALTGLYHHQHESILLENGNILLFDNESNPLIDEDQRRQSSVLELEPWTQQIVWRYPSNRSVEFFSNHAGVNQRLRNGNTLITETEPGRAIEVSPDNIVVWEFRSPYRAGDDDELIAALYEMERVAPASRLEWLAN